MQFLPVMVQITQCKLRSFKLHQERLSTNVVHSVLMLEHNAVNRISVKSIVAIICLVTVTRRKINVLAFTGFWVMYIKPDYQLLSHR